MKKIVSLKNNDEIVINITKKDYCKIEKTIFTVKSKYGNLLTKLYETEMNDTKVFSYEKFKYEILNESKTVENIINDVLKEYYNELPNLKCVFLSGSYARGTSKLASDLDLHFFYKNGNYNYKYEEIICYIISIVLNKPRDCIDPTFILNFSNSYKKLVTESMTNSNLRIILKANDNSITYYYNRGKKRRFFLQYNNSRNIKYFELYIMKALKQDNLEWVHCFKVLYGKKCFDRINSHICEKEKELINFESLMSRIKKQEVLLSNTILKSKKEYKYISEIKQFYQSFVFEQIYEYIAILRMFLIYKNIAVQYINLFELYDITSNINFHTSNTIKKIYEYMWYLRKLTLYCYKNNITYGIHTNEKINYDISELNTQWNKLKRILMKDLNKMRKEL